MTAGGFIDSATFVCADTSDVNNPTAATATPGIAAIGGLKRLRRSL
jgi:hypothetical protein